MLEERAPIFQKIFGNKWQQLPEVFKRHYAIRESSNDKIVAKGTISVNFSWLIKLGSPILLWLKILPPKRAKDIPITVTFSCQKNPTGFCFSRVFYYPDKSYEFKSQQIPLGKNVVVELTSGNLGWKCAYDYVNDEVVLKHLAYVFKFFSWYVPIPLGLIMGTCHANEQAISDNTFKMKMQFTHFLFGVVYEYYGTFEIE